MHDAVAAGLGSRPPRGAWIETNSLYILASLESRAPHGARGLKPLFQLPVPPMAVSRPPRGAWIETDFDSGRGGAVAVAPPTGRVD